MGRPRTGDYTPKHCLQCGTVFRREDLRSMSEKVWQRRVFCTVDCRSDHQRAHFGEEMLPHRRPPLPRSTKACAQCGVVFERRVTDNDRWARQRFCSHECASSHRRRGGSKVCERCGETFTRGRSTDVAWEARRLCGAECQRAELLERISVRGEGHPAWKGDAVSVDGARYRARQLIPELGQCNRCDAPAEVRHHIDENTKNNDLSNIEQLCRDCHLRHHNPVLVRWRRRAS